MDTARYRARRHESSQTDADAAMAFISNRPGPRQFQGTKERAQTDAMEPSYGRTRDNKRGKRKQPKGTRRGAGVTCGTSGATATPENKGRGKTEAVEPSYG